jgi:hypothetical protein
MSSPSDDDFVVLSRPKPLKAASRSGVSTPGATDSIRTADTEGLAIDLAKLTVSNLESLGDGKKPQEGSRVREATPSRSKGKAARKVAAAQAAAESYPSPAPSPALPTPPSNKAQHKAQVKPKKKKKAKKATTPVPDSTKTLSINGETDSAVGVPSVYEEAVGYITSYVTFPSLTLILTCDNFAI